MQKYQLRLIGNLENNIKYLGYLDKNGIIHFSSELWKDEIVFETELSFDEIKQISFVVSIKTL